jgi:methionine sulfoxide reductase heme-binding subunit
MPVWTSKRTSERPGRPASGVGGGAEAARPAPSSPAPPRWRAPALAAAGLAIALVPLVLLGLDILAGRLTANPVQEIEQQTGKAAYVLLLLSLAVTPGARLLGVTGLLGAEGLLGAGGPAGFAPLRRVLGWSALVWALVHLLVFIGLDYGFDGALIWGAVADKRFALVGMAALALLVLRAAAGWRAGSAGLGDLAISALPPLAAALATLHYLWAVKVITGKEIAYALVTVLLLATWAVGRLQTRGRMARESADEAANGGVSRRGAP